MARLAGFTSAHGYTQGFHMRARLSAANLYTSLLRPAQGAVLRSSASSP